MTKKHGKILIETHAEKMARKKRERLARAASRPEYYIRGRLVSRDQFRAWQNKMPKYGSAS